MTKQKIKYTAFLIIALVCFVSIVLWNTQKITDTPTVDVSLKEFEEGTKVTYQVTAAGQKIEADTQYLKSDGILSIPLSAEMVDKIVSNEIQYEIDLTTKNEDQNTPAQTLKLLLNLDKASGDVSVSASGLDQFSSIQLTNGQHQEEVNADWAGMFSTQSILDTLGKNENEDQSIQLAFQNAGVDGDLSAIGSGKVEVLFNAFGDADGSNADTVRNRWGRAVRDLTAELSSVMVMQTFIVGTFFDAKIQLETQRKHQELHARAHKDYHPSEHMCRIGTFVKSVAHSESKSEVDKRALNRVLMNQYLGMQNSSTSGTPFFHNESLQTSFVEQYCDPKDNGGALAVICDDANTAEEIERKNKDIDYHRTFARPLTFDVDFANDVELTADEEDLIALGKNLYFTEAFSFIDAETLSNRVRPHFDSRSYAAKMSVAHAPFINIVGMKASAPEGQLTVATANTPPPPPLGSGSPFENVLRDPAPAGPFITPVVTTRDPAPQILDEDAGWAYMKALLREFGIADSNGDNQIEDEIDRILGERPSYYAQMEVLTKKIYQHPNFYTNLYDKPANVKRIGASIDAIMLMNQRDRFESLLRREMISAVLLEQELDRVAEEVNAEIEESIGLFAQGAGR